MHRDMLVHNETNAYLHVSKTWEKVLEVSYAKMCFLLIRMYEYEAISDSQDVDVERKLLFFVFVKNIPMWYNNTFRI